MEQEEMKRVADEIRDAVDKLNSLILVAKSKGMYVHLRYSSRDDGRNWIPIIQKIIEL